MTPAPDTACEWLRTEPRRVGHSRCSVTCRSEVCSKTISSAGFFGIRAKGEGGLQRIARIFQEHQRRALDAPGPKVRSRCFRNFANRKGGSAIAEQNRPSGDQTESWVTLGSFYGFARQPGRRRNL